MFSGNQQWNALSEVIWRRKLFNKGIFLDFICSLPNFTITAIFATHPVSQSYPVVWIQSIHRATQVKSESESLENARVLQRQLKDKRLENNTPAPPWGKPRNWRCPSRTLSPQVCIEPLKLHKLNFSSSYLPSGSSWRPDCERWDGRSHW